MVGLLRGPPTTKQKKLFSINGENSPGSCVIEMLFYEVQYFSPGGFYYVKFVCGYFYWLENNMCQKKIRLFETKNWGGGGNLSKSVLGCSKF